MRADVGHLSDLAGRTTVWVDEEDLEVLKAAAARTGRSEADQIRSAIRLEAMRHRRWDEPFFEPAIAQASEVSADEALDEVWDAKAAEYRRTS